MEVDNLFSWFDYIILALTLIVPIGIGIYYGLINETTEDMLVGGRKMSIFPIAASIMATTVSAITVLGYPAEVYSYGIQIFQMVLVSMVCIPISVHLFIPYFYKMRLTSVYEYLELRFNSVLVRYFASFTFILQQILLSGIVLYAPSIALETFLGFSPWVTIIGIGIAGTIYTSIGGLKAVVWTDTFQLLLMYIGIMAILIKGVMVAGGISRVIELASDGGRLQLFDLTADAFMRHNTLNFCLGFGFTFLLQAGTRQHDVQRYSSLPTLQAAKRSVLLSIPIKVVALAFSLFTGVAIYAVHAGCDPILLGQVKKADGLIPLFVVKELAFIPGMLGLFTSCMFCAVLSSYSSSLNGIVAVTWIDFLSKLPVCQKMSETNKSRLSILVGSLYGILIVTLAFFAKHMGAIYQASYAVTGPPAGVLGGVFVLALFVPFVDKHGALGGMIVGLSVSIFICLQAFFKKVVHPTMELNVDSCPDLDLAFNGTNLMYERLGTSVVIPEVAWPEKMYTISYLLYPVLAGTITIISGISISLIVRMFSKESLKVDEKYLHPYLQKRTCVKVGTNRIQSGFQNGAQNGDKNGNVKLEMCDISHRKD